MRQGRADRGHLRRFSDRARHGVKVPSGSPRILLAGALAPKRQLEHKGVMPPEPSASGDETPPRLFGTWGRTYGAVVVVTLLVIAALALFSNYRF
jgi:hypothetical protein